MGNGKARNVIGIRMLSTALALVILLAAGTAAYAFQSYLTAFEAAYPAAVGSRIDVCVLCHNQASGGTRNTYGTDFAAAAIGNHTFSVALGAANSDGTGGTNNQEIAALTFPGDANDPAPVDNTAPVVNSTVPASNATNVATNTTVTATFSEAIAPATVTNSSFILRRGVDNVVGTVSANGAVATFTPSAALADNTTYTATLTTAVTDVAGNALADNVVWSFTTAVAAAPPPIVVTGDDGGGCAMAGTGGGAKELAGAYGALILAAVGLVLRRRRKEK